MPGSLLIVGASGRAAAASAIRAGFEPFVIDLFADADTVRLCPTQKCNPTDYPYGFVELAKQAPPGPWMYTGGLENYPDIVATISETRPLWGNGPDQLPNVRDPFRLFALLSACGIRCPHVCPEGPPRDNRQWLWKSFGSAGGKGVAEYDDSNERSDADNYVQEFTPGSPASALFVCWPWRVDFLGFSAQLVGTQWLHARPFEYAGNIGPLASTANEREELDRIGHTITQYALKTGLFGVDLIRTANGVVTIEVNPRYTASVEVYELAARVSALRYHASAATDHLQADPWGPWEEPSVFTAPHVVGKAIYYAAKPITFPASGPWNESLARCTDVWRMPDFADIPRAGSVIEPGQPVFTLFAAAATEAECVNQLKAKAAACDRLFGVPTPEDES